MMKKRNCKIKHLLAVILSVSMISSTGINVLAIDDGTYANVDVITENNEGILRQESIQDESEKLEESLTLELENKIKTITFDANGGSLENDIVVKTNVNGKFENNFQMPQPVREGFEFLGWYTAAEGGEKVQKKETVFTENTIVYAHWTEKKTEPEQKPQPNKHIGQLTGIEQTNAGGTGSKEDPYRIVADNEHKFTAPDKFWKIQKENAIIKFENRENNTIDGTLLSSYEVDGKKVLPFRFCFINGFDTSTGQLRFSHAWKGKLKDYFKDYEYKINVEYLTKDFPENKQIHKGDTIKVTQYGNYDDQAGMKSKDYSIDFNVSVNKPANLPVWERTLVVDDQGFAVFTGADAMERGGNYLVEKVEMAVHNAVKIEGRPATCTETGIKDYYKCEICGKFFEDAECTVQINDLETWKIIPATGHTFEWIIDKEPSVTETGLKHQECTICKNKHASVEIPKVVEKFKKSVTASTPKTGDNMNLSFWLILLAGAGIVVIIIRKRLNSR